MDAITLIQQNLDIEKLLNHYKFEKIKSEGNFIRACCKLHNGDNPTAFVINKENGLWFCHTNCGGGDVFTLVQKMENLNFPAAVRWVASFFNINIHNLQISPRKTKYIKDLQDFIKAVKAKRKENFSPFIINEEIKEVIRYRNFKEETLKYFQVGYAEKLTLYKKNGDKYTLYKRLVFPIIFNGIQIGVSLRRINSKDYPKWSHQPVNLETKKILYNYDNVQDKNTIVICEGINDVLAFHEINIPAVATFGSHISEKQYHLLLKTGADLVFAFDGDKAGQLVTQRAVKLFKNKANIYIVSFAENEDPESIEREVLENKFNQRLRCT